MLPASVLLLCFTALSATARKTTDQSTDDFYSTTFSTLPSFTSTKFAGSKYTYVLPKGQSTVTSENITATASSSEPQTARHTTSHSLTLIGGSPTNSSKSGSASSTTSSARASNTVPCNNYPEFCNRQYSNITEVCAHNSAFAIRNNAGSNQYYGIWDQLTDGIRMLQGETHWVNETIMNCHTSCDLLDAGTWQSSLELLVNWLERNPYNVVTWLIVNSDFVSVDKYVPAIQHSGISRYLYEPDYIPQRRDQWPTLGEMILSGKRVVLFMDYKANQTEVPYIMEEFTHIWETPFSPTNQSFPCTLQRPPGLGNERAREQFMYLANHNLNTAVDVGALTGGSSKEELLIPNTADINKTNGQFDRLGQLGAMSLNCTNDWTRPPNFLLVDYYNYGDPKPGSVFEVAAKANGVIYNRRCCGYKSSKAPIVRSSSAILAAALAFAVLVAW